MGVAISFFKKAQTPASPKAIKDHDATIQSFKSDSEKVTNIFVQIVGDDAQSVNVKKSMCTQTDDSRAADLVLKHAGNQTDRLDILSFRDFVEDHGIYGSSPPDSYRCDLFNLSPRASTVNPIQQKHGLATYTKQDKQKSDRQSSSVSVIDMESDTEDDVTLSMDDTINLPTTSPNIAYKSLDFDENDRNTNTYETPITSSCINKGYYETKDNLQANYIHAEKGTQYSIKEMCDSMTQTDVTIDSKSQKDRQMPSRGYKTNQEGIQQATKMKIQKSNSTIKSPEHEHTNNTLGYNKYSETVSPYNTEPKHQARATMHNIATQTREPSHTGITMTSPQGNYAKNKTTTATGEKSPLVHKPVTSAMQTENKLKYITIPDTSRTEQANKQMIIDVEQNVKHSTSTQTTIDSTTIPNNVTSVVVTKSNVSKHTPAPNKEIKQTIHKERGADSTGLGNQPGKKLSSIQTQTNEIVLPTSNQKEAVNDTHHVARVTQQIPDVDTKKDSVMKTKFGFAPMCSPSSSAPPTSPACDQSDSDAILVNYDGLGGARELRVYIPTGEDIDEDMGDYDYNRYTKTPLTPIPEEDKSVKSVQSMDDTLEMNTVQHVKLPPREKSAKSISTQTTDTLHKTRDGAFEQAQPARTTPDTSHGFSQSANKTPESSPITSRPTSPSPDVRPSPDVANAHAQPTRDKPGVSSSQSQPVRTSPDVTFANVQPNNIPASIVDNAQPAHKTPEVPSGHSQKLSAHTTASGTKHGGFSMHRENSGSSESKSEFEMRFDLLNKQDGVPFKPEVDGYSEYASERSARTLNEEAISLANTPELRIATDGSLSSRSMVDAGMKKIGKCKIRLASDNENCILTAATFMDNGGVVIVDRANKKVKFIDGKFQFISQVEVTKRPWGVCAIGSDIYVTIGKTKIQQITLDQEMVLDLATVIETKEKCLGLAGYENRLAIGLQRGQICLMSLSGEAPHMINLPFHKGRACTPWHLCVTKDNNILVTDAEAELVFCVNKNSEVLFHYKEMSSPRGCTIDIQGSIIVVGRDQESGDGVHVMKGGVKEKTLMPWWSLEFVPYCAAARTDDGVIILGGIKDAIQIYKYSPV